MMEFVVDWNSVCLVCLQEGEMRSIYDKDDKDIPFSDKIMKCAPIEITNGMNMPEQICLICIEDLAAAYRFRTNCESSNVILKSFIDGTIVNDVELPSYNGQVYRYKPPIGLDVKRVKPIKNIKVEAEDPQYDEEDDNISYTDELYVSAGENELNPDAEDENGVETVITYEEEERPIKIEKDNEIEGYSDSEDYGMKIEKSDGEIIQVFDESDIIEETVGVVSKIRPRRENKKKASDKGPGKRGRPKSAVSSEIKSEVNSANVQAFVEGLTTSVAFKRKTRVDGKPMKICEICGNSYKYQHALESHMRRHRNEKPYSCEFCDRAFVANVELRRHMRVHTGQKPYGCNYCSRKFSDFGSRIKHERTHTGERPYQCSTCGKSFAYAHVLSVHLLTHTGEKKFKCEVCGKGFTKKLYLLSHMNHHQPPITRDATTPVIVNEYIVPTDLDLFKTEEVS